jgi:hypothetical protein
MTSAIHGVAIFNSVTISEPIEELTFSEKAHLYQPGIQTCVSAEMDNVLP